MNLQSILETATELSSLKPDGFDGDPNSYDRAIIGITEQGQLVYSKEKMVEILVETEKEMDKQEAWEFLEYNCFCAYVGEQTPLFVNTY